jgi:hypothetical protein
MAMTHTRCLALLASLTLAGCDSGRIAVVVPAPTTLRDGLLAHYTFDETSGTTVYDHSGNRHDCTIFGNGWYWIPDGGAFGGALHLGGANDAGMNDAGTDDAGTNDTGANDAGASDAGASDDGANDDAASDAGANDDGANDDGAGGDYVRSIASFPNAPSDFSVSAWIRTAVPPFDSWQTIASTEIPNQAGWELNLMNPLDGGGLGVQFAFPDVTPESPFRYAAQDSFGVAPNQWTHITGVVDSTAMRLSLYVGDQLVGNTAIPELISPGSPTFYMGTWSQVFQYDPRFLVGDIDDMSIYGRALQAAEVQELGVHPPPDPL